ncbi:MAG TPA: hypothetical protein DCZ75_00480 [Geobacter sp.]|nr:hypothetical protein [Geobacter sp.]
MRKTTVRSGIRFISAGIIALMAATFFHAEIATLLFLGTGGEARLTFLGFFLSGILGGYGVLLTAFGFLRSGAGHPPVRVVPSMIFLFSLIVLFFVLAYTSITTPRAPTLRPGESISI